MLSSRRKNVNIYSKVQSFSNIALKSIAENHGVSVSAVQMLVCMNTLQLEQNIYVGYSLIKLRTTFADNTLYKGLKALLEKGYINRIMKDRYNVTADGRYLVMVFNTDVARMINGTKLSKWERLK